MKKLSVMFLFALVLGLMAGEAFAVSYCKDYLEPGNPGGWNGSSLKTFEEQVIPVGTESILIDIWLNDLGRDPVGIGQDWLVSGGFEVTYDPTITIVGVTLYTNLVGGPWDFLSSTVEEFPSEVKILVKEAQLAGAIPDDDDDMILAKLEVQGTGTLTISTVTDFDTVVSNFDGYVYDPDIEPNVFCIGTDCGSDPCEGVECDDGDYCNGLETCVDGQCIAGAPVDCDNGAYCDGEETCNVDSNQCESSGDPCPIGTECNEDTNSCDELSLTTTTTSLEPSTTTTIDIYTTTTTIAVTTSTTIGASTNCIDCNPDTLNINSCGNWVTVYIELAGYNSADINASTILLNGEIPPVLDPQYGFVTSEESYLVDEGCEPEVIERMVKFDRDAVAEILPLGNEVEITITGDLNDGTPFEGTDIIRVMASGLKGDFNYDGDVDGSDAYKFKKYFGRKDCIEECCKGDFECDGDVDGTDAFVFKGEFGSFEQHIFCL